MKKFALITALFASSFTVHATDWTPLVRANSEYPNNLYAIANDLAEYNEKTNKVELVPAAKNGTYTHIKQPYRADLLPAKLIKSGNGTIVRAMLKNATAFGLPLEAVEYETQEEVTFSSLIFKPMTDQQYKTLKSKAKIKKLTDENPFGRTLERKGKKAILSSSGGG